MREPLSCRIVPAGPIALPREEKTMASTPEANPDSVPPDTSDSPEQVTPLSAPGRERVEDLPAEPAP